jgi:hypothetical protein
MISLFYRDGPALFKFDHVFPSGKASPVTVILYAQLGTAGFKKFHGKLVELSDLGKLSYIYRHYIKVRICLWGFFLLDFLMNSRAILVFLASAQLFGSCNIITHQP